MYDKRGFDPLQQKEVLTKRRRMAVAEELPMKEAYGEFVRSLLRAPNIDAE